MKKGIKELMLRGEGTLSAREAEKRKMQR